MKVAKAHKPCQHREQHVMKTMLKQVLAITFIASSISLANSPKAYACADVGHLDGYQKGASLQQIIGAMNRACPSTIILNAGMDGFAVCEESRFSRHGKTIFLIGNGNRVTAIRRGPNSYGRYCAW
jgi:hypothetical protein